MSQRKSNGTKAIYTQNQLGPAGYTCYNSPYHNQSICSETHCYSTTSIFFLIAKNAHYLLYNHCRMGKIVTIIMTITTGMYTIETTRIWNGQKEKEKIWNGAFPLVRTYRNSHTYKHPWPNVSVSQWITQAENIPSNVLPHINIPNPHHPANQMSFHITNLHIVRHQPTHITTQKRLASQLGPPYRSKYYSKNYGTSSASSSPSAGSSS